MAAFAERFGFTFRAHEKGDANRSARVERPSTTSRTTSSPAASFADLARPQPAGARLVRQGQRARTSSTSARAPSSCSPAERPHLKPLPLWVPEVYRLHHRIVDVEGYVNVNSNRYSVPTR